MNITRAMLNAASIAAVTISSVAAAPASPPRYEISAIAEELDRQCKSGEFAGAVVVRVRGQNIFEHACGEADALNGIPNRLDTRFKIYSTSKFITALTVMRLVERQRIDLDAPLMRYVPDVPKAWSAVTVRQLLNHTSGIKDLTEALGYAFRSDFPSAMRSTLAALTADQQALATPPGTQFAYNNFGFELLAAAVSNVERRPFPEVVQQLVFDPAGMRTASFQAPSFAMGHPLDAREPGLAVGYNGAPDKLEQATSWSFIQVGAGAVRATVNDFIALDAALSDGRLISPAAYTEMVRAPVAPPPQPPSTKRFGLGIIVASGAPVRMEGHTGGTNGYISDFERYPDDGAMMVALTNRGFTRTTWLRDAVAAMLAKARSDA